MSERLRLLLVDDNPSIHEDFRKILGVQEKADLASARAAFLGSGDGAQASTRESFEIDSALQGQEALALVQRAQSEGRPYSVAFVDVRMPPGWDGVRTIEEIWKVDSDVQTVICTAFADYSWDQMVNRLGHSDRLLILKKPFDTIEIRQLASGLTRKWGMIKREKNLINELRNAEHEARAYASSLETVNRALVTAKAAADKSLKMKSDFLVHLSGQIYTQMHAIFRSLEQLRRWEDPSSQELHGVEGIVESSRYLVSVFDHILDLTRIENGRLQLERERIPVLELTHSVIESQRPAAAAAGVELSLAADGALPETILSDPERYQQILAELLSNAIRHTRKGSIQVRMRLEPTEDWREPTLRVDVSDTGTGVAIEHLGLIFEPFFRGEQAGGGLHAGLGLGLARATAQLLGGDITVDTAAGRGSTFTLTLDAGDLSHVPMVEAEDFLAGGLRRSAA